MSSPEPIMRRISHSTNCLVVKYTNEAISISDAKILAVKVQMVSMQEHNLLKEWTVGLEADRAAAKAAVKKNKNAVL